MRKYHAIYRRADINIRRVCCRRFTDGRSSEKSVPVSDGNKNPLTGIDVIMTHTSHISDQLELLQN